MGEEIVTWVTERDTGMATLWLKWFVTDVSTAVGEQPGVNGWIGLRGTEGEREGKGSILNVSESKLDTVYLLPTEAEVGLGELRHRIVQATFWT